MWGTFIMNKSLNKHLNWATSYLYFSQERVTSHSENMQYLNLALQALQPGHSDPTQDLRDNRPLKRDSRGQTRNQEVHSRDPFSIPFGLNLAPVQPDLGTGPEAAPEHGPARTQTQEIQPRTPLTQSGLCSRAGGRWDSSAGDCREVTTNDLLDCLAHPDVIARVMELLLERHVEKSSVNH